MSSVSEDMMGVFMGGLNRLLRLSPSEGRQPKPRTAPPSAPAAQYYGVYIPCELEIGSDQEILHVYEDKSEALGVVKKYKKARFKSFVTHQEAVVFALQGLEPLEREPPQGPDNGVTTITNGEKPSQFKGPKPQEMVQFRKMIESGDLELVKKTVTDNPRYLVSSGDTPSILQEGSRYNALHVSVKARKVEICNYILSTVSDPNFIQLLYGDDNIESCKERARILLDLYLNTPDKATNETPLHFAVKFGAKEIVDLLVSFPQCSKTQTNKLGEQPKDIICQRVQGDINLINEISAMLEERFYVPVLHSEDGSNQPIIGEPFSPGSHPTLNIDPISPRLEIRAYAGPMNKSEAYTFRKKWKTPPRSIVNNSKTPLAAPRFRLQDIEKGLEKVGRCLAQESKIGWKEYWPFLDTFTDLTSSEGLELLEEYLGNKHTNLWNSSSNESFSDSLQISPKTPTEKSVCKNITNIGDQHFKSLNNNADSGLSPMSDLCLAFKLFSVAENEIQSSIHTRPTKFPAPKCVQKSSDNDTLNNSVSNAGLNPHLCIEKSCQVFARRMSSFLSESEYNLEHLETEIKHLQQTIASYINDARFRYVDFNLVHSRVAQLAARRLLTDNRFYDDLTDLKDFLAEILDKCNKNQNDGFSSDEEENYNPICRQYSKSPKDNDKKKNVAHTVCLTRNVLKWLEESKEVASESLKNEDECISVWSKLTKCTCFIQTRLSQRSFKNDNAKRNHFKSREDFDTLSSSPKSGIDLVVRKLFMNETESELSNPTHKTNDDESNVSITYDSDGELFATPSYVSSEDDSSEYEDADNGTSSHPDLRPMDVFITGTRPTKTDKSVYDAISDVPIEYSKYPYTYRWRHTIGLYSGDERNSWPSEDPSSPDELDSPITCSFNIGHISNFGKDPLSQRLIKNIYADFMDKRQSSPKAVSSVINPIALLTPTKSNVSLLKEQSFNTSPSLQASKWMRVTGPNSPRSTLMNKSCVLNGSFRL